MNQKNSSQFRGVGTTVLGALYFCIFCGRVKLPAGQSGLPLVYSCLPLLIVISFFLDFLTLSDSFLFFLLLWLRSFERVLFAPHCISVLHIPFY